MSTVVESPNASRVPEILVGTIIPTALSSIIVVARLYTRGILNKTWGLDDTLVAIAWLFSIGTTTTIWIETRLGLGHHSIYQNPTDMTLFLKLTIAERILYQLVLWFTKMGLCVFYRRVFQDKRSIQYINWTIGFLVVSEIIILALVIFQCIPIEDSWSLQFAVIEAKCMQLSVNVYVSAVCNIVADIVLVAFAVPRVLPLNMPRSQKIAVLTVVSLGILVIAAAIVRCISVIKLPLDDSLWYAAGASTWSTVEMQTGLFCISAPCIRSLLRRMFPEFMSSTSHNRAGQVEGTCRTIGSVSIYRKGPSFSSRDMGLEGGFQSLDELVLDQVSESTKNLCTLQPSSSMENET